MVFRDITIPVILMQHYSVCSPSPGTKKRPSSFQNYIFPLSFLGMVIFILIFVNSLLIFSVFDSLLYRPPTEKDCVQYEEVQRVLREEIVNPLRAKLFVRADRVMKLRTLLENHSSVTGLTSEEKGICLTVVIFLISLKLLLSCFVKEFDLF